jgi:hypothetical protein
LNLCYGVWVLTRALPLALVVAFVAMGCRRPPLAPLSVDVTPATSADRRVDAGPSEDAEPVRVEREPFSLAWSLQTKPFNKGVAVSGGGYVASLASRHLSLHDHRGKRVADRDVCFTFNEALGFVADATAAVVCENEISLYAVPALELSGVRALPEQAREAAFAIGRVAVGFAKGPVRVYETETWTETNDVPVDQRVTALALSRDGKHLAIGLEGGDVLLRDLVRNQTSRINIKRGFAVDALDLSPNATKIFAAAGPIVAVYRVDNGAMEQRFRSVGGVSAARWVGGEEIGSVGRDGLLLLDVTDGTVGSVGGVAGGEAPVSIVVARDDQLCSAGDDGMLFCYARGKLPPTLRVPITSAGGIDAVRMAGRVSHFGATRKRLQVRAHPRMPIPPVGANVAILRYTEAMVGEMKSARWIEVADGAVSRVKDGVVYLRLAGALRNVDLHSDPLPYDTPIKLVWHP